MPGIMPPTVVQVRLDEDGVYLNEVLAKLSGKNLISESTTFAGQAPLTRNAATLTKVLLRQDQETYHRKRLLQGHLTHLVCLFQLCTAAKLNIFRVTEPGPRLGRIRA